MYHFSESIAFGGISERKELTDPKDWTIINLSESEIDNQDNVKHIPLKDGSRHGGNKQQEFANAVNTVRNAIQNNENVFVHCAIGQSRSVSVLSTAIAAENNQQYDTIQAELMTIRNSFTEPAMSLQKKANVYLRHDTH